MTTEFENDYLNMMEKCFFKIKEYPHEQKPSFLNLSTMTMICDLTTTVDIKMLSENFRSPSQIEVTIKKIQHNTDYSLTKRGKKKKTFFNQASLHFTTHTTKCVKVFSNGKLHITGVTSMIEAETVATFICSILNKTIGVVKGSKSIAATNLQICMINTNFSMNHGLHILALKNFLHSDNIVCQYTPDTYPGLKIKFTHENKNKTSIFIFSSGQIVITGAKQMSDIIEVYTYLMDIMNDNFKIIFNNNISIKEKTKNKQIIKYKNGYPITLLDSCDL